MDLFIQSDDETSDLNHGLKLSEGRKNYQQFGAVLSNLKKYARQPEDYEYPRK
ncbi:CPCC family cysteine-rich protein [Tissierellaceae bacterium HCP3S3_D8]